MASYHLCCKVISRGQGRSATAAAAAAEVLDRAADVARPERSVVAELTEKNKRQN